MPCGHVGFIEVALVSLPVQVRTGVSGAVQPLLEALTGRGLDPLAISSESGDGIAAFKAALTDRLQSLGLLDEIAEAELHSDSNSAIDDGASSS